MPPVCNGNCLVSHRVNGVNGLMFTVDSVATTAQSHFSRKRISAASSG
jgi:hypothetical protein